MEFLIMCPNDGAVEVGLDNIASIIVRGDEAVDVVFSCPRCGDDIRVSAQVPKLLMATLADTVVVDEETGEATLSVTELIERGRLLADTSLPSASDFATQIATYSEPVVIDEEDSSCERIDRYCEYFRRQLADTATVDAMLREIDGT